MSDSMMNIHFLTILREDEFRELKKVFPHDNELLRSIRSIRYCKAEVFRDCILGTLRVPEKNEIRTPHVVCGFYLTDKELFLIEDSGKLKHWIEKKEEEFQELKSPDQFLLKMMELMIENDLLAELNFDNIPNVKNIGQEYFKQSRQFDSENKYSVPYCWGTVGILYNKTMVDEPITSWSVLWDEKYIDNILMQDSVRDAFAVALKYKGHSLNSTDLDELEEAKELLIEQKPLVQAYVIDQVRDKMIGNEAAIGVIYSGEAIYTQLENPNLEYVIPKEGSNVWIDSWVIPKNAKHKENAEAFINFLCRPDIAKMNFDYITYSTPNTAARELIEDPAIRNSKIAFPDASELERCETFQFLGDKNDAIYNKLWREIKSQ